MFRYIPIRGPSRRRADRNPGGPKSTAAGFLPNITIPPIYHYREFGDFWS
jgi:hypothetical protein